MNIRDRPPKTAGFRTKGWIVEANRYFLKVRLAIRNKKTKEITRYRVVTLDNTSDNEFKQSIDNIEVNLIFLTPESLRDQYKKSEYNKPYQILDPRGYTLYRQSVKESKETILGKLEQAILKENNQEQN